MTLVKRGSYAIEVRPMRRTVPYRFAGIVQFLLVLSFALAGVAGPPASALAQGAGIDGKEFQAWRARCQTQEGQEFCEIYQNVLNEENQQPVLQVIVAYPPPAEGAAVAAFIMPLGVLLPPGVAVKIDEGEPLRFPVQRCQQVGCVAQLPLDKNQLANWRAGATGSFLLHRGDGQTVSIPFSLSGFTAASDALKALN